ncbi:MAG: HlyD family type I secretion periplasmic adaptor subunit [Gammaproteobacteria bacterium]|nr:MAG: HlyD family type I secretion periplasmic adaptor subunit [Gammaproteobacteria bacterium]
MIFKRQQGEHEFLPATLEIQETPPSPLGRLITWVIIIFFVTAIIWALIGKVDIVVTAPGRLITSGHAKIIQPLDTGIVQAIYVTEGQVVSEGDILIELKPDSAIADEQRLESELASLAQDKIRAQTTLEWIKQKKPDVKQLPLELDPVQQQLLLSQWHQHRSQINTLKYEQDKYRSEQDSIKQQVKKYESILPILTKRADKTKMLSQKQLMQEDQYLEIEQQRLTIFHDHKASQQRTKELKATINEVGSQIEQVKKAFNSEILSQLQQASRQYGSLKQEKIKATANRQARTLKAPVSGVVQQLIIHTQGGVVTPAQQLMVIVPSNNQLEVEAMVANQDIGFVKEDQAVEIKIDAFPFTKYGVIDGTLDNLSNDAIADEQLGLIYKAQISMQDFTIQVENKSVNLSPGMTVSVEIKTGKRRLIEYFLAPLLRYKQESIRER